MANAKAYRGYDFHEKRWEGHHTGTPKDVFTIVTLDRKVEGEIETLDCR